MSVYQQIASNKRKTWFIVGMFTAFVVGVSWVFAQVMGYGPGAVGIAMILAGIGSFATYWFSDRIVLTMSGARPATRERDFEFFTVTENLCLAARLPMPDLYVIEDTAMNAFATGRDPKHAVVCATTGLLQRLDRSELEGVVAHELSHIENYDIRLMAVVSVMVGFIALIADIFLRWSFWGGKSDNEGGKQFQAILFLVGIVLAILSPIAAQLIQLAISRNREFLADASAAKLTHYPEGLVRALQKISADREPLEAANKATAHMYISDPLKNHKDAVGWFAGLFQTHPPVDERISRLKSL
ncbi:M48 family metallopeptidase [Candidatus Woesebacteria bacterium]|nr:M48 family metallopeptidase [Candidatus Woesebacteria bacterium]MCD8507580.1 M48 family metallopeptidase [Candidatus Woesebacteria bacterium]MCD8527421.1 M48 family metallopeptidase [Candidatus Woesebacteria bacterium]MCD8546167.1 M48 family metallopeptidase [Candidatus Woesebacteria bacterium]